ncbi:hypothetical protein LguiA_017697 [Lonicera macranthoides]
MEVYLEFHMKGSEVPSPNTSSCKSNHCKEEEKASLSKPLSENELESNSKLPLENIPKTDEIEEIEVTAEEGELWVERLIPSMQEEEDEEVLVQVEEPQVQALLAKGVDENYIKESRLIPGVGDQHQGKVELAHGQQVLKQRVEDIGDLIFEGIVSCLVSHRNESGSYNALTMGSLITRILVHLYKVPRYKKEIAMKPSKGVYNIGSWHRSLSQAPIYERAASDTDDRFLQMKAREQTGSNGRIIQGKTRRTIPQSVPSAEVQGLSAFMRKIKKKDATQSGQYRTEVGSGRYIHHNPHTVLSNKTTKMWKIQKLKQHIRAIAIRITNFGVRA